MRVAVWSSLVLSGMLLVFGFSMADEHNASAERDTLALERINKPSLGLPPAPFPGIIRQQLRKSDSGGSSFSTGGYRTMAPFPAPCATSRNRDFPRTKSQRQWETRGNPCGETPQPWLTWRS